MMGPGGQQIGQLPGGMTHEDLENRQSLEYDLVMAGHLQHLLIMSADLVKSCSDNEVFEKMPGREEYGKQAMMLHADFAAMEVLLLETIRKKIKGCKPFAERKDLKLRDIRKDADVLMDPGESKIAEITRKNLEK